MKRHLRHALLACGLFTCSLSPALAAALAVRVATVDLLPQVAAHQISGRVEAIHSVAVRARTEGTILKMHIRDGQYVSQGDLLYELDDAEPRSALTLARAELQSAEATLRQAEQLLSRYQRLQSNHSISRNDVDNARMQRDVASAAVSQARARVEARKITLGYARIYAPIDGRVGQSQFHVGNLVNPASGVLVEIVQLDPVRVAFALDEKRFASKTAQHPDISALKQAWLPQIMVGDTPLYGELIAVDNRIDPRTGSVALRAEFANPQHRLLPGGSVDIWLRPWNAEPMPVIPAAAVQQDAQGFYSWVVDDNSLVQTRRLRLAGQEGQRFSVAEGLTPGERVVTEGAQRLRSGLPVEILE